MRLRTAHQAYQNSLDDCSALEQCEIDGSGCEMIAPETTCRRPIGQILSVYSLVPLEQAEQSRHLKDLTRRWSKTRSF